VRLIGDDIYDGRRSNASAVHTPQARRALALEDGSERDARWTPDRLEVGWRA